MKIVEKIISRKKSDTFNPSHDTDTFYILSHVLSLYSKRFNILLRHKRQIKLLFRVIFIYSIIAIAYSLYSFSILLYLILHSSIRLLSQLYHYLLDPFIYTTFSLRRLLSHFCLFYLPIFGCLTFLLYC